MSTLLLIIGLLEHGVNNIRNRALIGGYMLRIGYAGHVHSTIRKDDYIEQMAVYEEQMPKPKPVGKKRKRYDREEKTLDVRKRTHRRDWDDEWYYPKARPCYWDKWNECFTTDQEGVDWEAYQEWEQARCQDKWDAEFIAEAEDEAEIYHAHRLAFINKPNPWAFKRPDYPVVAYWEWEDMPNDIYVQAEWAAWEISQAVWYVLVMMDHLGFDNDEWFDAYGDRWFDWKRFTGQRENELDQFEY